MAIPPPIDLPCPQRDESTPYLISELLLDMKTSDMNSSLIHLYRGELSRQLNYRNRLDRSTQWAVTIASTLTVMTFAYHEVPGYVHSLIAFFVCVFLILESRRYMYYSVVKYRVRTLELGYYGKYILGPRYKPLGSSPMPTEHVILDMEKPPSSVQFQSNPQADDNQAPPRSIAPPRRQYSIALSDPYENPNLWMPRLVASLRDPRITMTLFQAVMIRAHRVYWGLLIGVFLGWVMKVSMLERWDTNVIPASVIGGVMALCSIYVYWLFPITQKLTSPFWQRLYWASPDYFSSKSDVDV